MELSSCHFSGTCDLEVGHRFLENLWAYDLTQQSVIGLDITVDTHGHQYTQYTSFINMVVDPLVYLNPYKAMWQVLFIE